MQSVTDINADIRYRLNAAGIKPSPQRMAIARYIAGSCEHPTVDLIYASLHDEYPTLSRTTVYNTVKLLSDSGCISAITIEPEAVRYDYRISPHAHFLCSECGALHDLPLESYPIPPEGFMANDVQIYFRGICKNCKTKQFN